MKLQTPVAETPCKSGISFGDKILLLGSCFSDSIGRTLLDYGFDALVNPFGTLYNPASIRSAVERLASGEEFKREDCVPMGSGAGKICSFSHHTSFARSTEEEFLENANSALRSATAFFRSCSKVIITLGTAWCYRYVGPDSKGSVCDRKSTDEKGGIDPSNNGKIVSNCLKRDAKEFVREKLSLAECVETLIYIIGICSGKDASNLESGTARVGDSEGVGAPMGVREPVRPKDIIFTVSPIRHLADGAHENQLSKSTLLLAVDDVINHAPTAGKTSGNGCNRNALETSDNGCDRNTLETCDIPMPTLDYFPAYEIMMDELRDYRFYAEDMLHPSAQAVTYITERFLDRHLTPAEKPLLEERIRLHKQSLHRLNNLE